MALPTPPVKVMLRADVRSRSFEAPDPATWGVVILVVKVGVVCKTTAPVPVEVVWPVPPLATARVPVTEETAGAAHAIVPDPSLDAACPDEPVEDGKVLTPMVMGVAADSVMVPVDVMSRSPEVPDPMILGVERSVRKVGDVRRTRGPEPVAEVWPVPPLAIGRAPDTVRLKTPAPVMGPPLVPPSTKRKPPGVVMLTLVTIPVVGA